MKINDLFENTDDNKHEMVLTTKTVTRLFNHRLFLKINFWSEYDHECEVAIISNVANDVTDEQFVQLTNQQGVVHYSPTHFIIRELEDVFTGFDPGVERLGIPGTPRSRPGQNIVHLLKFNQWADIIRTQI